MSEKTREICTVVSQESIGAGIYSMWIQTDRIAADAKPGQFVSLYTNDKSKILPRPIRDFFIKNSYYIISISNVFL